MRIGREHRETVVRAGAVVFASEGRDGFTIPPGGFTGWTDPVGTRLREVPRISGPGAHAVSQQLGTRLVSLSGRCYASNPRELDKYGELLAGLGADGEEFTFHVQHASRTLYARGFRAPGVRFESFPALNRADYQFDIWCPDPRKYGGARESASTGSNVEAFHYGNTDAWPVFEVTGFPNGYRVEGRGPNQGLFYTVTEKPSAAVDRIDFQTGMITRNGSPIHRVTTQKHVWPVAPNVSTPWRVTALGSGAGTATMTVRDTWL